MSVAAPSQAAAPNQASRGKDSSQVAPENAKGLTATLYIIEEAGDRANDLVELLFQAPTELKKAKAELDDMEKEFDDVFEELEDVRKNLDLAMSGSEGVSLQATLGARRVAKRLVESANRGLRGSQMALAYSMRVLQDAQALKKLCKMSKRRLYKASLVKDAGRTYEACM